MDTMQDLAALIAAHAPGDGVHETTLPGVALVRSARVTEPLHLLHRPALCIVAQGAKQVMLGDLTYEYDPAKYLVVSVDLPLAGHVTCATPQEPYLCLRVDLDAALLADLVLDAGALDRLAGDGQAAGDRRAPARGLFLSDATPDLTDAAARLLRLLDTPRDAAVLAPLVLREIHYRLLTGEQGGAVRHIVAAEGRLGQVGRAIAWIKAHYTEPFSIGLLAAEARMSPSALHQSFKAVTAMSPLQYQKQVRLQEARRLMVAQAFDAAQAGFEVGYESASQFTREYRRLFGESPARDAQRLRSGEAFAVP